MRNLFLCILICNSLTLFGQMTPQKNIDSSFIKKNQDTTVYQFKKINTAFQSQIKAALLYYPELKDANITFKVKKSRTPLSARPSIWAVFQRPKNRRYIVVISDKSVPKLEPILLKNLSYNAQVGVLGHELSHVSDFHQRKGLYFIKLFVMHTSRKAIDKFENNTDKRCIEHGLGYQLLAWSTEVRQNLKIGQWHGAKSEYKDLPTRERYMSPQTITRLMMGMKMYQDVLR